MFAVPSVDQTPNQFISILFSNFSNYQPFKAIMCVSRANPLFLQNFFKIKFEKERFRVKFSIIETIIKKIHH